MKRTCLPPVRHEKVDGLAIEALERLKIIVIGTDLGSGLNARVGAAYEKTNNFKLPRRMARRVLDLAGLDSRSRDRFISPPFIGARLVPDQPLPRSMRDIEEVTKRVSEVHEQVATGIATLLGKQWDSRPNLVLLGKSSKESPGQAFDAHQDSIGCDEISSAVQTRGCLYEGWHAIDGNLKDIDLDVPDISFLTREGDTVIQLQNNGTMPDRIEPATGAHIFRATGSVIHRGWSSQIGSRYSMALFHQVVSESV